MPLLFKLSFQGPNTSHDPRNLEIGVNNQCLQSTSLFAEQPVLSEQQIFQQMLHQVLFGDLTFL